MTVTPPGAALLPGQPAPRKRSWPKANAGVKAIRASTGLSQAAFARSIGVAKGTLLNWEHGRRRPTGPAQVLLAMIARKPSLVREMLREGSEAEAN